MHMDAPVLDVRGLSIAFSQYTRGLRRTELHAVRDLSVQVRAGEVTAVVGASGSGKSLLAHGIFGLLPYNARMSGSIEFLGAPLDEKRLKAMRGRELVLIPQGVDTLDPLMKVGRQLRLGGRGQNRNADVCAALGRYGLEPQTQALYPFELSGGMARRVLIASAVLCAPRLIVADEPTPGLEQATARRILAHLRELADAGAGVLLITHELELALTVADRILVFYAGSTLEEAKAADFEREETLRHPFSRALWRAMPRNGFSAEDGEQPGAEDRQAAAGCPWAPRCPQCEEACGGPVAYRPLRGGFVRCGRAR